MKSTPIFVCSKDRVSFLKILVSRLHAQGYDNLTIVDTGSTYPPMLEYLLESEDAVIRLKETNVDAPQLLFWIRGTVKRANGGMFVYTDSDVVPADDCPDNWLAYLTDVMKRYHAAPKAGLGLKTDDLPDCYNRKQQVIEWEKQYNQQLCEHNLISSAIDTTLALYRNDRYVGLCPAVRTTPPYMLRHLPWYSDSSNLTEEEKWYRDHMVPSVGMWKP